MLTLARGTGFVASCIRLAAVSSLYTTLNMYTYMSSGDSIHCSTVFCLGVGEACDINYVPPVYVCNFSIMILVLH